MEIWEVEPHRVLDYIGGPYLPNYLHNELIRALLGFKRAPGHQPHCDSREDTVIALDCFLSRDIDAL